MTCSFARIRSPSQWQGACWFMLVTLLRSPPPLFLIDRRALFEARWQTVWLPLVIWRIPSTALRSAKSCRGLKDPANVLTAIYLHEEGAAAAAGEMRPPIAGGGGRPAAATAAAAVETFEAAGSSGYESWLVEAQADGLLRSPPGPWSSGADAA